MQRALLTVLCLNDCKLDGRRKGASPFHHCIHGESRRSFMFQNKAQRPAAIHVEQKNSEFIFLNLYTHRIQTLSKALRTWLQLASFYFNVY
ncbi:hypothetical protein XENTR_v10001740 [Xenopus tropicalis]|nr:hypothetical protein XENTR_v10001740 [Xenopus tropicalis]